MKWKDFKSKPMFPRDGMQVTVMVDMEPVEDEEYAAKTIVVCEECKLSLWDSQMKALADILADANFKQDMKILWRADADNRRRIMPYQVTEEL